MIHCPCEPIDCMSWVLVFASSVILRPVRDSASIACYLIASHCMLTVRFNDNKHLISIVYQATALGAFQVALRGGNHMKDFLAAINKLSARELDEYLVSSSSFAVSMSTHHTRSVDCCVWLFGW